MSSDLLKQALRNSEDAKKVAGQAEQAVARQRRESAAARGEAPHVSDIPIKPVKLPGRLWGERQREAVGDFIELLPIIEIVAGLPAPPTVAERGSMTEAMIEEMMNSRLTSLLKAKEIVVERVRKEI